MDKLFKLKENGTDVRTEVLAGLTTFFAMSYILFVNPQNFFRKQECLLRVCFSQQLLVQ